MNLKLCRPPVFLIVIILSITSIVISTYSLFKTGSIVKPVLASTEDYSSALAQSKQVQQIFNQIARRVVPAVVRINVSRIDNDPGSKTGKTIETKSFGSGVIIEKTDGYYYILTNEHVVVRANSIEITLFNNTTIEAEYIGVDKRSDIGLIRVKTEEALSVAKVGDSDMVTVGDWAICIGNPLGFNGSLSVGVISALGRSMFNRDFSTDFIQTDAAVNPGNSGGPLLNIDGEIVGLASWIATDTGANTGLSFAVPINNAMMIYRELKEKRSVEYAWLGVMIKSLTDEDFRKSIGEKRRSGAYITEVINNSPASKSGFAIGDVIVAIDNTTITNSNELIWSISKLRPGAAVKVIFFRNGIEKSMSVILETRPGTEVANNKTGSQNSQLQTAEILGATVTTIDNNLASKYSITKAKNGVVVIKIIPESPSELYGVLEGDLITRINSTEIKTVNDVAQFNNSINPSVNKQFFLYIIRGNREFVLGIQR